MGDDPATMLAQHLEILKAGFAERLKQRTVEQIEHVTAPDIEQVTPLAKYIGPAPPCYAAPAPVIEHMAYAPAVTCTAPAPVIEIVAPTPAVTSATPAPVIENMAYAPAVTYTAPAPVIEIVAPTPAVTSATPAPVIETMAYAPAITYTAPAPVIEIVTPTPAVTSATPAPVIETMAYAPAVTYTAPAPVIETVAPTPAVTSATPAPVIEHVATPAVSSAMGPSVSDVFEDGRSPASAVPDQPGDPARRDFADTVLRQGYCRHAGSDTTTGPSDSDCGKDGGSPARAVHRQSCGRACDQADRPGDQACQDPTDSIHRRPCGDATTGPLFSGCAEDGGSPADAVHRQRKRACDHAGDQACRDSADSTHRQGRRRAGGDATTFSSAPQILNEIVEVVEVVGAVKNGPQERISEKIDDDTVPVDQPGDPARRDFADTVHRSGCCRAVYDATTGPSFSGCAEDGKSPAGAVHRQSCGGGSTTEQQDVFDPGSGLRYAHIGCMDCYMNRSFEELRWEDYQDGRWQATSTLRRGPRWPSGPAFTAETPSASPHVPARDEPAENTDPVHRQSDGHSAFAGTTDSVHPKSVEHSTSVCAAKPVLQLCEPLSFLAGDSVHRRSDGHSTFVGATNPAHRQSDKHFEFPRVTGLQCDDFASRTAKSGAHSADDPELPVIIWIEGVTGSLKGDRSFGKWLHDGTVLCELVNKIQPGSVNWINYSKLPHKQKENINHFRKAARAIGIPSPTIFNVQDLYEGHNMGSVINCIELYGMLVQCKKPEFFPKLCDED